MQYCLYQYSSNYTKKRRATAIRHQGSPQAHLQNGVTPRISQVLNVGYNAHVHFEVVILMTLSKNIKKVVHKTWTSQMYKKLMTQQKYALYFAVHIIKIIFLSLYIF